MCCSNGWNQTAHRVPFIAICASTSSVPEGQRWCLRTPTVKSVSRREIFRQLWRFVQLMDTGLGGGENGDEDRTSLPGYLVSAREPMHAELSDDGRREAAALIR